MKRCFLRVDRAEDTPREGEPQDSAAGGVSVRPGGTGREPHRNLEKDEEVKALSQGGSPPGVT